jgi:erythromycin esterase
MLAGTLIGMLLAGAADEKLVESVRGASLPIRTIAFDETDDSDLEPLIERIGGARVVVLGEICHSDGTTFEARARLIRFLHRRMGFDVLAWEAGLLDCRRMNDALRSGVPAREAAERMMRGGWDVSEPMQPLFEYARTSWRGERPLEMAGFDGSRPPHGAKHLKALVADLKARAPGLGIDDEMEADAGRLFDRVASFFSDASARLPEDERARQREAVEILLASLEDSPERFESCLSAREAAFAAQVLRSALDFEEIDFVRARGMLHGQVDDLAKANVARDAEMGRLLVWLADHEYAGRKIAVVAATAHFTRNTARIEALVEGSDYRDYVTAGDHVARALGRDLYVIAFTASGGAVGREYVNGASPEITAIGRPAPDSFEGLCSEVGAAHLFLDLRGAPANDWRREARVAWPLGFGPARADWTEIVDAFFVVRDMKPDRILPARS